MAKFQYNYSLFVQKTAAKSVLRSTDPKKAKTANENPPEDFLLIEPPLTIEFDIMRNILSSANVCSIKIYNLSEKHRFEILKDNYDFEEIKMISLNAGYGSDVSRLPQIFFGNAVHVYSYREGSDFITEIECFDAGNTFNNAFYTGESFKGKTNQQVIEDSIRLLSPYGIEVGAIDAVDKGSEKIVKGISLSGSIAEKLAELATDGGAQFFIDAGLAFVLKKTTAVERGAPVVINSEVGLLGTPRRERSFIHFDMIFEPDLFIGGQVDVQSTTGSQYNGINKVLSIHHRGKISGSVGSSVTTTIGIYFTQKFNLIKAGKIG